MPPLRDTLCIESPPSVPLARNFRLTTRISPSGAEAVMRHWGTHIFPPCADLALLAAHPLASSSSPLIASLCKAARDVSGTASSGHCRGCRASMCPSQDRTSVHPHLSPVPCLDLAGWLSCHVAVRVGVLLTNVRSGETGLSCPGLSSSRQIRRRRQPIGRSLLTRVCGVRRRGGLLPPRPSIALLDAGGCIPGTRNGGVFGAERHDGPIAHRCGFPLTPVMAVWPARHARKADPQ